MSRFSLKGWHQLIGEPWKSDPFVVLIVVPEPAKLHILGQGECVVTVMEHLGTRLGLQVTKPEVPKYNEQLYLFRRIGIEPARADYVGRFSGIPTKYLVTDDYPIAYLRDDMSGEFINIKACARPQVPLEKRMEVWS